MPADLARALLAAGSASERQRLLPPATGPDFYVALVGILKDETDRLRLQDPRAALRAARIAEEIASQVRVPRCQAIAAWALANVLIHQGDYAESLRLYQEAAAFCLAAGEEINAARLASNQAWVLKNLGRYDEGVQAARAAVEVLRAEAPGPFLAGALNALGTLHRLLGRCDEALLALAEAGQIYAALGDEVQQARLAINRANVLETMDRPQEAIALLCSARDLLAARERWLEVARADLNLGILHTRLARYDQALDALDRAEAGFAALDNAMEVAVVALYRADLYAEFNLHEELLQEPAPDWRLFQERGMQWHAARAALHRAAAWQRLAGAEAYHQAAELLAEARAAFARLGDPVWASLTCLEQAGLWCKAGDWAPAYSEALRAAAELRQAAMPLRAAGGSLLAAHCCLAMDRPDKAGALFEEVLDLARQKEAHSLLYRAHHGLALVFEAQGHLDVALDHYRQAIDLVEDQRRQLAVEDFRLGYLEDKLPLYAGAILLCLQLEQPDEALTLVERCKSGSLADLLLASLETVPPGEEADAARIGRRLAALGEQLSWHYNRLEAGGSPERGGRPASSETELWPAIAALEQEATRTWRRWQQAAPFHAIPGARTLPAGSAPWTGLAPGEVLVQYHLAGDRLHAFVTGREGRRASLALGAGLGQVQSSLAALEIVLHAALQAADGYRDRTLLPLAGQQLAWLYDDLLAPLETHLAGASRLVIAPDGPLFQVPFHALHDGQDHVLARFEVAYTPSASILGLCRENRRRRMDGPARLAQAALVVGTSNGGRLPHIPAEVEAVARTMPRARVLAEGEATVERLQELAGQVSILHLATHAVFRRDNPLFSALRLGEGHWLRLMDLYRLRLRGCLVTLSGCETGRHRLRGGDLWGLSRGFFFAGAAALVVSLWPVDDVTTARLMADFYRHLTAGQTAAGALRQAQLDLCCDARQTQKPAETETTHPAYWAPFCLMGMPEWML